MQLQQQLDGTLMRTSVKAHAAPFICKPCEALRWAHKRLSPLTDSRKQARSRMLSFIGLFNFPTYFSRLKAQCGPQHTESILPPLPTHPSANSKTVDNYRGIKQHLRQQKYVINTFGQKPRWGRKTTGSKRRQKPGWKLVTWGQASAFVPKVLVTDESAVFHPNSGASSLVEHWRPGYFSSGISSKNRI